MNNIYYYLSNAYDNNHYEIDKPFQAFLTYFLGKPIDLFALGKFVGKELYEVSDYIDKRANPKHIVWSIAGERIDEVWLDLTER